MNASIRQSTLTLFAMSSFLAGCASTGGSSSVVVPPPPPPPTTPSDVFCPPPVTGDCRVDPPYTLTFDENTMTGGRDSDYALVVDSTSDGFLTLWGDYRFGGGTAVQRGTLIVAPGSTLVSNTTVSALGMLWLGGTLRGDVLNHGYVRFGQIHTEPEVWPTENLSRIEGNLRQTATGTLAFTLGWTLHVTGDVHLDGAAELRAVRETVDGRTVYRFPDTPTSSHLLHADGGVSGQFSRWTSPGLFVEGSLRYGSNDVWFDLTRISLQGAMAASGAGDAHTLYVAGHLDDAFRVSDAYAISPDAALSPVQRRFLRSAAAVQHLRDLDTAVAAFDSLSGHGHRDAADRLVDEALATGAASARAVRSLEPGAGTGAWSSHADFGVHHWVREGLLVGGRFSLDDGALLFDRSGGSARSRTPRGSLYLFSLWDEGVYAIADVGYGHHALDFVRPIDLGAAVHAARSDRTMRSAHFYAEAGRRFSVGEGRLAPFAALGAASLRGGSFIEQGETGFELAAPASRHDRVVGDVGLEYSRSWNAGRDHVVRMAVAAGARRLMQSDDRLQAAFAGTPEATFDVLGVGQADVSRWTEFMLTGERANAWSWRLGYRDRSGRQAVTFGFRKAF